MSCYLSYFKTQISSAYACVTYGATQVDQIIQKGKQQEKKTNKQKETNMGDGTRERLLYRINHLKGGGYIMEASSSQENPSNQATKMTVDS